MAIREGLYATCLGCKHALSAVEQNSLRAVISCPSCGATEQFGPGVFVEEFEGYTWDEVREQRHRADIRVFRRFDNAPNHR